MLTVNLFDDCFRHAHCSTGWQIPEHVRYVRDQMEFDGITLFTDGYINDPVVEQVKSKYKIGWLHEPECLHPENYQVKHPERFDFILTYHAPLVKTKPIELSEATYQGEVHAIQRGHPTTFRFAPYGGVWIPKQYWGLRPKTKLVSMLYGNKLSTEGHRIRHEIANAVRPLGIVDFYGYEGEPVNYSAETKLKVLGDYAFSIVTETCYQENLFTEILLDCFAVGTIPIFWGCPNVGEFFNKTGILSFQEIGEIQGSWGIIQEMGGFEIYRAILEQGAIEDNLNRVADYAITEDWLYHNVLRELV